ncbi:MAG: VCBS repeat-containing protein [Sedimentisphaerales bacterium]|nr:VCBS repeat-containing protein [Sedimentisphaerales bacterium]
MFARRSQPIVLVTMFLAVVTFTPGPARGAMPRFECHTIAEVGYEMGQTSLADIDKDGDLDWVVGERKRTWWFEYAGPDQWIQHDLGDGGATDVGGTAFDVDGDGWIDQAAGNSWYRNTGKPRTELEIGM